MHLHVVRYLHNASRNEDGREQMRLPSPGRPEKCNGYDLLVIKQCIF